jgi:hypothetical protein
MSPQMTLTGHEDGVHLAGALEVPVFNLNVRELPTSAVNVSRGVVVTSYPSDRPDLERSISAGEATLFDIPITANLKISLGEQVVLAALACKPLCKEAWTFSNSLGEATSFMVN